MLHSTPAPQRRPSLRRALIRFLGGQPEPPAPPQPQQGLSSFASQTAVASAALAPPPPPARNPAQVLQQAERYFVYAEHLSQQGSGDLAGAVYRQAYLNLRALVATPDVALPPQPVLPPAAPLAPPPPPPLLNPLERQLQPLKEQLSSANASAIEQQLRQLLHQGQRSDDLSNLLGLALLLQDRRDEAERWFRDTLSLNPRHHRALVNLGGLCLTSGRAEEAVQVLSRALEGTDHRSSEGLAALTNLSLAQQQLGRPMEAAQLALSIFRIKPDHLRPESLLAAANTLEQMGQEAATIEILRHLHSRRSGAEITRRLAQLLERRGDFQEAALIYRDLLASPGATTTAP